MRLSKGQMETKKSPPKKTAFSSPEGLKALKEALYSPRVNNKMVKKSPEWHELMEQRRQAERDKSP